MLSPPARPYCPIPVHLWRFSGGYPALMDCMNKLKQNKVPLTLVAKWGALWGVHTPIILP